MTKNMGRTDGWTARYCTACLTGDGPLTVSGAAALLNLNYSSEIRTSNDGYRKITVFWDVIPCSPVDIYQRFRVWYTFTNISQKSAVSICKPESHARRQESS
jgi:hypothetical protein